MADEKRNRDIATRLVHTGETSPPKGQPTALPISGRAFAEKVLSLAKSAAGAGQLREGTVLREMLLPGRGPLRHSQRDEGSARSRGEDCGAADGGRPLRAFATSAGTPRGSSGLVI